MVNCVILEQWCLHGELRDPDATQCGPNQYSRSWHPPPPPPWSHQHISRPRHQCRPRGANADLYLPVRTDQTKYTEDRVFPRTAWESNVGNGNDAIPCIGGKCRDEGVLRLAPAAAVRRVECRESNTALVGAHFRR